MENLVSREHLDEVDGLNPTRALILQAYFALRRTYPPTQIGTVQIATWIERYELDESVPSDSLVLLTLRQAKVVHRPPGRPRSAPMPVPAPPLFLPRRPRLLVQGPR